MNPTILSLFSGCGGLDLGFRNAGFNIVVANDNDRNVKETFEHNFPDTQFILKDIKQLDIESLPDVDGIIGGPPCQSWSVAGKSKGIEDLRGQLFYNYINIIKEKQPKFFLAENVSGMMSAKHKEARENILKLFDEAGYDVSLTQINAKDYGVPQDRKRIFFIGFRKDLDINFVFPKETTENSPLTLKDTIYDLRETVVSALDNKHNPDSINNNEYYTGGYSSMYMSRNRKRNWDQQAFTVQASGRQCQLHPDCPAMEKIDSDHFRFAVGQEDKYRRLSVREIARIQTFPDDFKFIYNNIDHAYKMIGNAVPVNLAYEVAKEIKEYL